jgi:hypothetical protein
MKLLRGKNWIELQFGKKGRKGLYVGPLFNEEKDIKGKYNYKLFSFMTRRLKIRFIKDRASNKWEFSFGGLWSSQGTTDQYVLYNIKVSEFVDKG